MNTEEMEEWRQVGSQVWDQVCTELFGDMCTGDGASVWGQVLIPTRRQVGAQMSAHIQEGSQENEY